MTAERPPFTPPGSRTVASVNLNDVGHPSRAVSLMLSGSLFRGGRNLTAGTGTDCTVNPFELMRSGLSGFAGGTPTTAPLLRRAAGAACLQRVRTPICSGATSAAASNFQQLAGVTAAVVRSGQGAAFWQLVIAFVCGGLFVTCSIGFLVLAYTYGATNVDRAKKMISLVVRRTVRGLRPCSAMCLHLACAHACDPVGTH